MEDYRREQMEENMKRVEKKIKGAICKYIEAKGSPIPNSYLQSIVPATSFSPKKKIAQELSCCFCSFVPKEKDFVFFKDNLICKYCLKDIFRFFPLDSEEIDELKKLKMMDKIEDDKNK